MNKKFQYQINQKSYLHMMWHGAQSLFPAERNYVHSMLEMVEKLSPVEFWDWFNNVGRLNPIKRA